MENNIKEEKSKYDLIDIFVKSNPMPERTYCKEARKIENITLYFEYEYTKSEELIQEMEDEGLNTDKYITEGSKKKFELAEIEQEQKMFEHTANCDNEFCKWAHKRDLFVKEHTK